MNNLGIKFLYNKYYGTNLMYSLSIENKVVSTFPYVERYTNTSEANGKKAQQISGREGSYIPCSNGFQPWRICETL